MTEHTDYETRTDGSIDTAHYLARGREMRSAAFWEVLAKCRPARAAGRRSAGKHTDRHPAAGAAHPVPAE